MPLSILLTSERQLRGPVCWLRRCTSCNLVEQIHYSVVHTQLGHGMRTQVVGATHKTNFPELAWIKKLSSFQSLPDWSWALILIKVEMMAYGHKSDWQAPLSRGALWYLRWWLDRQIIILPIRVPFSTLWSLQRLMACSHGTASGCLRSHYPTGSPVVINDKRLEYWFVNLQSGAIWCSRRNYMNLPSKENEL